MKNQLSNRISVTAIAISLASLSTFAKSTKAEFLWTNVDYYGYCDRYARQGKSELAIEYCNKAIKLNPKSANAYVVRGILYSRQNKNKSALADF